MKISIFPILAAAMLVAGCTTERPATPLITSATPTSTPGGKYTVLPAAVQRTITETSGAAEILDITKVPQVGQDIYEVQFVNTSNPTLYVTLEGSLVKKTAFASLTPTGRESAAVGVPLAVQKTLQLQAPNAVVANIQPTEHTIYKVTFVDPDSHPKMLITEDGNVLKEQ